MADPSTSTMIKVLQFYLLERGRVIQQIDCPYCGAGLAIHADDRIKGNTYEAVCPSVLCGGDVQWTYE
jgi:ribosomal protein S27AE